METEKRDEQTGRVSELKRELNAVVLSHYYEEPEIQKIGDYVGDSLGLCIEASRTDADVIVFCGVHFMAESAKLLNPDKRVLMPDTAAGCPMADMAGADDVRKMKAKHPGAAVITYVNSTAAVKAESDICCTSSNAVKIVQSIPDDREIIFVPDQNLGHFAAEQAGRDIILWPGYCPVHQVQVTPDDIRQRRKEYPEALVLVHPECTPEVIGESDFAGSTSQILAYAAESDQREFIIGTEKGILHPLRTRNPEKSFIPASDRMVCGDMKKITLDKVISCMEKQTGVIEIAPDIREAALLPIRRMLELS